MTPNEQALRADLEYIVKSHACTQVNFDKYSAEDYPKMINAIMKLLTKSQAADRAVADLDSRLAELKQADSDLGVVIDKYYLKDRIAALQAKKQALLTK